MPTNIKIALFIIWLKLIAGGIYTAAEFAAKEIEKNEFLFILGGLGLFSIFPYKIAQKSKGFRYVFTVLTVIELIYGLIPTETKLDVTTIDYWINAIPTIVSLSIINLLFSRSANEWFSGR